MTQEQEVLVEFSIELYYASNLNNAHIMPQEKWAVYEKFFNDHLEDTIYLGEQEGKHSEIQVTGQELLDSCEVTSDADKLAAFRLLYGEERTNSYILGNIQEHQDFDYEAFKKLESV